MSAYIEPAEELSSKVRDQTRALNSLKEEIEAIDWYNQRVDAATDTSIAAIMAHNRDEEIEHACMAVEWLRRNMPGWDEELRTYLFSSGDITKLEEGESSEDQDTEGPSRTDGQDLNIGSLKK